MGGLILDRGGDVHLHLGLQQHPGQRAHGDPAPRHHGRLSQCAFLLAHLPGAAEMTGAGALSMYWGLALAFGLFALLLVMRGRLGKQDGPG